MGNLLVLAGIALLGALAVYCFLQGIKALRTGSVDSPTMLSPGTTKRSESPISFWIQVGFWVAAACVIGYNVVRWLAAVAEA